MGEKTYRKKNYGYMKKNYGTLEKNLPAKL